MKARISFSTEKRNDVVKESNTARKICKGQCVPVEERKVRRKKRITGENPEYVGLIVAKEVRQYMFKALDRYKIESENRFNGITQLNNMVEFLKPQELLQNKVTRLVGMLLKPSTE